MVKKHKQLKKETQESIALATQALTRSKLKKIAKPFREYIWYHAKHNNITQRTERILTDAISNALGQQKIQDQFQQLFRKSQTSYSLTSHLFQTKSLKDRYKNLLEENTEVQEYQDSKMMQRLTRQQEKDLQKVKKLYRRYKVSSMYRTNVVKQIRRDKVDRLEAKGCLKQITPEILTLAV